MLFPLGGGGGEENDSEDSGTLATHQLRKQKSRRVIKHQEHGDEDKKQISGGGGGVGAWPRIERINTNTGIRRFPPEKAVPGPVPVINRGLSDTGGGGYEDWRDGFGSEKPSRQTTPFPGRGGSPGVVGLANELGGGSSVHPRPRPIIAEIIRTKICLPGAVFLVERIEDIPVYLPDLLSQSHDGSASVSDTGSDSDDDEEEEEESEEEERPKPRRRTINNLAEIIRREEAARRLEEKLERRRKRARHRMVRLFLGDGEVCIQGLLRPRNFGLLDGGVVYEGCYVRLGDFELVESEVDVGGCQVVGEDGEGKSSLDREDDVFGDPALAEEAARIRREGRHREKQKQRPEMDRKKMYYLVVGEMVTVGWNNVYLSILRDQEVVGKKDEVEVVMVRDGKVTGPGVFVPESGSGKTKAVDRDAITYDVPLVEAGTEGSVYEAAQSGHRAVPSRPGTPHNHLVKASARQETDDRKRDISPRKFLPPQVTQHPSPSKPKPTTTVAIPSAKMNVDDIEEYISDGDLDDEAFEKLDISMDRVIERRHGQVSAGTRPTTENTSGGGTALQELQAAVIEQNKINATTTTTTTVTSRAPNLALAITDPSQPLKLTPLRSIPNLPYKQNWMVNVLAVVVSLSPVEPAHLPPYSQRTARLADPSTSKRVLLTVFLDPEEFTPAVGSVVLLVGVKNHRFDGGCLKKYASDRPRDSDGTLIGNGVVKKKSCTWWLENPRGLDWCCAEVERLMSWWREQQEQGQEQEEQQQLQENEADRMQMGE